MVQQAYGFENNWYYVSEIRALNSLRTHGRNITYLIPFWFGVTEQGGLVDQSDPETLALIRQFNLPVLAIIHNYASPQYGPLIHRLLTTGDLRRTLVANILNMLRSKGFSGVNIDFQFVPPEDRPFMTTFMSDLYRALKPYGFLVTISVPPELQDNPAHPFSGAFSYPDLSRYSDQVYVLAYDEHVAVPGPIASIGWVRRVLAYALSVIPREKIRLGMAVYGRDWSPRTELPVELSYKDAINTAVRHGAEIRYDEEAQELTYTYTENGVRHIVWFEDVTSFTVRLNVALQERIPGIGVWRLGLEDPLIWNMLSNKASS
ncbi:MAG: glycoside hydrolase [Peptococcaceae bacterium]|nr:glycoside hydrolase [Peptococcaceae bacterium]